MSISSLWRSGTPSASSRTGIEPAAPLPTALGSLLDTVPLPRLLYVASTKTEGGIEQHSVGLAAALAAQGAAIRFACRPGSYIEHWCREAELPTRSFLVRNSGDLGAAIRLAQIICIEQIDLVHVHSRRDYVVAVAAVALARVCFHQRAALIIHAHMIRSLGGQPRLSGRFFAWGASAVVAVSGAVHDRLCHDHGFAPAFVRLIPNGVRLDKFALPGSPEAAEQCGQIRKSLGIPHDALVLGMIGRLDAKGQRQLLLTVPRLLPHCPSLRIVLVGSEGKPGEKAALTALAEAGGFRERLHFTGPRTDVPQLLTAFDLLVHLPIDEAFGLALAEAMVAGLPTVATDIGGCREVVMDGITGSLVPPGDPNALFETLAALLDPENGQVRRVEMGAAGFLAARSRFSQELQVERLMRLYRETCPAAVP